MMMRLVWQPGVDVERTPSTMKGGWVSSNLINFREGVPEKHLGWKQLTGQTVSGVARSMHFWSDLSGNNWLAIGSNQNLYVEQVGVLSNITPVGWPGGFADAGHGMFSPLIWSLDNFGQNLIGIPSGGNIYVWVPSQPVTLATPISQAPAVNTGGFVAMPEQILMSYGCTPLGGGAADPLLMRWCTQSDYTQWTASASNQAGSFRLSRGSKIVGGISCALGQFVWTDLDMWSIQYEGFPLVFGFNIIGANTGLLARGAIVAVGSTLYWASDHGFFMLGSGGVQFIPCTVWDQFYLNIVDAQAAKVIAGADQHHSGIYWFYPSKAGGSGEIDSYVKYNFIEQLWDFGAATPEQANLMARTAWTDQNRPGPPLCVDRNNLIQQQDQGVDANGQPMTGVFIQSGYTDLSEGRDIIFVRQLIPDFLWTFSTSDNPSLQITLLGRNWPGDTPTTVGPFTITPQTEYITCRARFREMAVKISCDGLGTWWRLGVNRLLGQADGRL